MQKVIYIDDRSSLSEVQQYGDEDIERKYDNIREDELDSCRVITGYWNAVARGGGRCRWKSGGKIQFRCKGVKEMIG